MNQKKINLSYIETKMIRPLLSKTLNDSIKNPKKANFNYYLISGPF